jgi:predicted DNA-binding transcriptional regulator AlpA
MMLLADNVEAFTIEEAARKAGVCRSVMYDLIKSGAGPRAVKVRRRTVVFADDFATWKKNLPPVYAAA